MNRNFTGEFPGKIYVVPERNKGETDEPKYFDRTVRIHKYREERNVLNHNTKRCYTNLSHLTFYGLKL